MSKQKQYGIAACVAVILIVIALLFGCSGIEPSPIPGPAAACPPDAKYCSVPVAMPDLATSPIGRLEEPVKSAKVMLIDKDGSDPRVVTQDIPAGVWLVEEVTE